MSSEISRGGEQNWASIRPRQRKDGTTCLSVLHWIDGRQTSLPFDDKLAADAFVAAVKAHGARRAREMLGITTTPRRRTPSITVTEWIAHYIDHLSGVDKRTLTDYRTYLDRDIGPALGDIPLAELTSDDVARWINAMAEAGSSGKTVANKHGALLSPALTAAVKAGKIPANPAAGVGIPRTERAAEMRFLSHSEFAALLTETAEYWRPLLRFLVASGARFSEVSALRPADVDCDAGTVRISRAWKRHPEGWVLGPTKTKKSNRIISLPASVFADLDLTGEWLFRSSGRNRGAPRGPVRIANFRANVWWPALGRAELAPPRPRIHDLRHTCASWMIQAGVPLPVIQSHLGHESIDVTVGVYGHLDRSHFQQAADAIGQALG